MRKLTCFKRYDIRGRVGSDIDEDVAYRIGRAIATALNAKTIVLGRDIRNSSEALAISVSNGLIKQGCRVFDLGLSGTEEMYFATSYFEADGGICITASHNPREYNGMKIVRARSAPLDVTSGLFEIKKLAEANVFAIANGIGEIYDVARKARRAYVDRVISFIDLDTLKPLKILVNAGHGAAGPTFDAIAEKLDYLGAPLEFERICHNPDGCFPQGIPNPLLYNNRLSTEKAVLSVNADFGVAWDGDFDRCFFFDHAGTYIDGEYVVGLLAKAFLTKNPGATIIHDPRIIWNTQDVVARAGGCAVQAPTGHAFIKQAMRSENAIYGGEMSAHHYFRDFCFCDSGMIPVFLIAELVSKHGTLFDLVKHRRVAYPSSGEINFNLENPKAAITKVRKVFEPSAKVVDFMDGVGCEFGSWRFNLRVSNTESIVRLNVESRGSMEMVESGRRRIESILNQFKK